MLKFAIVVLGCAMTPVLAGNAMAGEAQPAPAQGIKRTPLQRFDVPGAGYETIIGVAEVAPDVSIGRHTHPGPESGYVVAGRVELLVDGQPPRTLVAGDSYLVPAGTPHDGKAGPQGARVIATYVVEKGKPLASPAP